MTDQETTKLSEFSLIVDAPIKEGEFFGPCVIGPGNDSDWVIGYWNGFNWYGDDGFVLREPRLYRLLPPLSSLRR